MRAHPCVSWSLIAALLAAILGYPLHLFTGLAPLLSYAIAINVVTVFLYRLDKWLSPHPSAPRIPNLTLLLMAAVGGAGGALLGVAAGHKTSRRYRRFRSLIWFFAAVQLLLLAYELLAPAVF